MTTIYHGGGVSGGGKYSSSPIIPVVLDEKAKISATDTTTNYLDSKITVSGGLVKSITSPGANEKLNIAMPSAAKTSKFYHFGTGGALGVETFIPSTTAGTLPGATGIGHYIPRAAKVKAMEIMIPKYISYNSAHYTRFQIKSLVADGSRTVDITSASGTNLLNYDFTFPNTGGAYRYYIGKIISGLNLTLNAGEMLFVVICSMDVNTVLGASIQIEVIED